MATLFVRHSVSDYKTWRKTYDDFQDTQQANNVTAQAVYQAADDPNDVTVTHEFPNVEAAKAFIQLEELKNAMRSARVVGTPAVWITNRV